VEALAYTPSGKLDRRKIRERYHDGTASRPA